MPFSRRDPDGYHCLNSWPLDWREVSKVPVTLLPGSHLSPGLMVWTSSMLVEQKCLVTAAVEKMLHVSVWTGEKSAKSRVEPPWSNDIYIYICVYTGRHPKTGYIYIYPAMCCNSLFDFIACWLQFRCYETIILKSRKRLLVLGRSSTRSHFGLSLV